MDFVRRFALKIAQIRVAMPERSRISKQTFSASVSSLLMLCELPFFPNTGNYVADDEHDTNPRKYWFLVLDVGLFTKKCVLKKN